MKRTALVVTALVVTLGIYDLAVVATGGVNVSISRFMQDAGLKDPFIVFWADYICGHIWGYMAPKDRA